MKKSRYTEEQIVGILKESEAGRATPELCRKHGVSQQTFYRWKAKYGGLEVPMENGYIESFHGKFREECLNEHWFLTLDDARETIEDWRLDYNQVRPHSSLGYRTPEEFRSAMGCADVESKERFPHLHSPDYGCGITPQLN